MTEIRSGAVTLKGNPVDLVGPELKPGDKAPDFTLQNSKLEDVRLSDFAGKTIVLATVPSLDTPVCAAETKRFNEELAALDGVVSVVVSMDLPFAQGRWCQAENVDKVVTLSAHRCTRLGEDYGVLIKGGPLDRCLARSVFVIAPDGTIRYAEYVKEIAEHPNYEAILAPAKEAASV